MRKDDTDYSIWSTITEDDCKFLENLKEFLDEQERKRAEEIAFHRSVWDAALDATGEPLFGCKEPIKKA